MSYVRFSLTLFLFAATLARAVPAVAAEVKACYCFPDAQKVAEFQASQVGPSFSAHCLPPPVDNPLCDQERLGLDKIVYTCEPRESNEKCLASVKSWEISVASKTKAEKSFWSVVGLAIPSCLLEPVLSERCRDVSIFVVLMINFGRALFAGVGMWALAFFIYGGFNLIISAGNPEKIKKGTDSMLYAIIGLAIAFAGYLLIKFLGDAVGLKEFYQLK